MNSNIHRLINISKNSKIERLGLRKTSISILNRHGFYLVGQLTGVSPLHLMCNRGIGRKTLQDVEQCLGANDLHMLPLPFRPGNSE